MHIEFLIVGQGISGTFLSYYLQKEKRSFIVIDDNYKHSPSRIAAGIINPVTGRRMVKVWMAEEVLPFSWNAYNETGNDLNITAISQKNIIDFFPNPFMKENFRKRAEEGNEYIRPISNDDLLKQYFNYHFGCGEINPVYIAHPETLLPAWRSHLQNQNLLSEEYFDVNQFRHGGNKIQYKDIKADKIIFCDGAAGVDNPYFKPLPFAPNKGEALIIEAPDLPSANIYKKNILLAPLQSEGIFWAGSNYLWEFDSTEPTKKFREETERSLKEWLKVPFSIIDHLCGIRPATLERRPFAGLHPQFQNIGILNGMGTKGCSLGPFFAKQLTGHLLFNKPITPEANVNRFQKLLTMKSS